MATSYPTRTLRELARVIFARLVGIVVILVVVVAGVLAATAMSRWRYRSRALLLAHPAPPLGPLESAASLRDRLSLFVVTQRELIQSDYVLGSALMRLDGVPFGPGAIVAHDKKRWYGVDAVRQFIAGNTERMARARRAVSVETPGGPDVTFTQAFSIVVDWDEDRSCITPPGDESRAQAAERAQAFAECVLEGYLIRRASLEIERAKQSAEFAVSQATAAAKDSLDAAAKDLEVFIAKELKGDMLLVQNMLGGIGEMGFQSLRTEFQGEINKVDARLAELAALRAQIPKVTAAAKTPNVVVPQSLLEANPYLGKSLESIANLRLQINNLAQKYQSDFKMLKESRAELEANIAGLLDELGLMITQEAAALTARKAKLTAIVEGEKTQIAALAAKAAQYKRKKDDLDAAQAIYSKRREEALAAQSAQALASTPVDIIVVDSPTRPDAGSPHRPVFWLNMLISVLAGVVLALMYAFLADHFDHSVKSIDDVEDHVGVDVLASIPRLGRRILRAAPGGEGAGPSVALAPQAEEIFRGLWASVFYGPGEAPRSALVCSANRSEGATTVAVGMALAGADAAALGPPGMGPGEAEPGRVLLVDFNLRAPKVHRLLRLPNEAGLSDVLAGGADLDQAVRRVGPGRLDVLTVGSRADRVLEILHADRAKEFLSRLQERYERVILDAAPANLYPDARLLAGLVGAVVLVAHCQQTPREALMVARKRLQVDAAKATGVVLNLRKYPIPKFVYRRV